MSASLFFESLEREVNAFESIGLLAKVRAGTISMSDYHAILFCLFHQVRSGPWTFAQAAINMPWSHWEAKHYLLKHAYEECTHWQWIIQDLESTGYNGPLPSAIEPPPSVQAYVAFNQHVAREAPLGRLSIAAFLEGVGGTLAERYGMRVASQLGLTRDQMQFFLGHSVTDVTHSLEIGDVLRRTVSSDQEWLELVSTIETASRLYRGIYQAAELLAAPLQ